MTLQQGHIKIPGGELIFAGSQTLAGTGEVDFTTLDASSALYVNPGNTLTIAAGITVHGGTGFLGGDEFGPGGTIDNKGIIAADGGGTITVYGFTNFSGGTLTGGTWQAAGSKSVLQLKGADIKTNAANLLLDGAGADPRWRHHRGAGRPDRQYRRRQPDLEGRGRSGQPRCVQQFRAV